MNEMLKEKKRSGKLQFFDYINRGLVIFIVGLLGNMVLRYYPSPKYLGSLPDDKKAKAIKAFSVRSITNEVKPFSVYGEGIRKRNFFHSATKIISTDSKTLKRPLPSLHKRIRLLGILYDKDSRAIIEDLKERQVHFLSEGESLASALLEDIKEDKVVFLYNNERVEMAP